MSFPPLIASPNEASVNLANTGMQINPFSASLRSLQPLYWIKANWLIKGLRDDTVCKIPVPIH